MLRNKDGYIAAFWNKQPHRLVDALFTEVLCQLLAEPAGMRTHNPVGGRIIVGWTIEECLANIQFIDLVGAPSQAKVTNVDQEAAKAGRFHEARRGDDALYQLPAGITRDPHVLT